MRAERLALPLLSVYSLLRLCAFLYVHSARSHLFGFYILFVDMRYVFFV
jgi:hypothetical protein